MQPVTYGNDRSVVDIVERIDLLKLLEKENNLQAVNYASTGAAPADVLFYKLAFKTFDNSITPFTVDIRYKLRYNIVFNDIKQAGFLAEHVVLSP